jgi:DNA-binding MarR family transcriptional regulator
MATTAELLRALRGFGLANDRLDAVVARSLNAGPTEFKAMDHIHAEGDLTPGQLAERLALSSGAVTALIDRLERLGWVTREPHPDDRRSLVVRKAEGRLSDVERNYAPFAMAVRAAAEELTGKERAAFIRFLEAAAEAANETATELRGSGPAPTRSLVPGSPPTPAA